MPSGISFFWLITEGYISHQLSLNLRGLLQVYMRTYQNKTYRKYTMQDLTSTGLEKNSNQELAGKLNELLANYHIYYQNVRGFHWNIKGVNFFQLHAKFEELYTAALTRIDEIAERILTLGYTPLHSFTDYLSASSIKEVKNATSDRETVGTTIQNITLLIQLEREILKLAGESNDEGTLGLISTDLNENEKTFWMLNAFLNG
jgi:starvation-inducible DNA-binding protein